MAGQGFFFRTSNFISNCFLLSKRLPQLNQVSNLKQKAIDKLKELNIPEKPKRPLTPYFRFAQERRDNIMRDHPDWRVTQISAHCSAEWKSVDSSIKAKYESEFKKEMEQYAAKYQRYANSLTAEQKTALEEYNKEVKKTKIKKEKRKRERENDKPKRPSGAYMLYIMEQAKAQPNKSYIKLVADLKNDWANMPADDKLKYISSANKAREQYQRELKQWELKMINEGKVDIVRQSTLTNKSSKSSSK